MKQGVCGFTFAETIISLVLFVTILLLVVPGFYSRIVRTHGDYSSAQLLSAINLARSEAIKRHKPVSICPSSDGETCSSQWENKVIVYSNENHSLIRQFDLDHRGHLGFRAFPTGDYLTFNTDGMTSLQNGTFDFSFDNSKILWQVVINKAGRARMVEFD